MSYRKRVKAALKADRVARTARMNRRAINESNFATRARKAK